ncbi:MAG: integral rane protein [Candidatus Saccharibacteria bacterium]|nr:integral rane protein [Candidatus Saccharibacteria bacterium]
MATAKQQGSGFGVAALVLGIVSLLGGGVFTGIPALVFGILAVRKYAGAGFGMGLTGIITGALGILGGIIFLMVFISLPALQSSQRDTSSKNDLSMLSSAITSYSTNNRGALPSDDEFTSGSFVSSNLDSYFDKKIVVSGEPSTDSILFVRGVKCDEDGGATGARYYSLKTLLENGSVYCQSN